MHMWLGTTSTTSPMARLLQALGESGEFFLRTDFGIEAGVVGDVVAMHAAGMSHEERRGVAVGDSQIVEIFHDRSGLAKSKCQIQLETVSGTGDIRRFSWSSVLQCHCLGRFQMLSVADDVVWARSAIKARCPTALGWQCESCFRLRPRLRQSNWKA